MVGWFFAPLEEPIRNVARWRDGTWEPWPEPLWKGQNNSLIYAAAGDGTHLFVGGWKLGWTGESSAWNLAHWNGGVWSSMGGSVDGTVTCLVDSSLGRASMEPA